MRGLRLADISQARQDLVRLCQNIDFGELKGVRIKQGDPVLNPLPIVLIDFKLEGTDSPRPEVALADFALREEAIRLIDRLDQMCNGVIERLEIRSGIPRRVVIRHEGEVVAR